MNIYRDPFQPDAFLYERTEKTFVSVNGKPVFQDKKKWFSLKEAEINRTKFTEIPKLEKAELVPVWVVNQVVEIETFFLEFFHSGSDGMDAAAYQLSWLD